MKYIYFLLSLQFFLLPETVCSEKPVTEEYIVGILSGEKKNLNYPGKTITINHPPSKGISFKINFAYDSAEIDENSYSIIVALGNTLESKLFKTDRFKIIGHTDSLGTESYNEALSLRRAESVKQILTDFFSIKPEQLIVAGKGETAPIATNDNEAGRAKNRRVEIIRMEN